MNLLRRKLRASTASFARMDQLDLHAGRRLLGWRLTNLEVAQLDRKAAVRSFGRDLTIRDAEVGFRKLMRNAGCDVHICPIFM